MLPQTKRTLLFVIMLILLLLSNRVVANDATDPNCGFALMKPTPSDFSVDGGDYTGMQDINPLTDTSTHFFAHQSHPVVTYHVAASRPDEDETSGTQNVTNAEVRKIREAFKDWGRVKVGSVSHGNRRAAIEFIDGGQVSPDAAGKYNQINDDKNVIYWSTDNTFTPKPVRC